MSIDLNKFKDLLHSAASLPDEQKANEIVDFCLRVKYDINTPRDKDGYTPIMIAVDQDNISLTKKLLSVGANVNIQSKSGSSVLGVAANRNEEMFDLILKSGVNLDFQSHRGCSVLMGVLGRGDGYLKKLIDAGANLNLQENEGRTALMLCISSTDYASANLLLDAKADVNIVDKTGNTALTYAIQRGWTTGVKRIIAAGADVDLKTFNETTKKALTNYEDIDQYIKSIKVFKVTDVRRVEINGLNYFEGTLIDDKPDKGFLFLADGSKMPVRYTDGHFVLSCPTTVAANGDVIVNL